MSIKKLQNNFTTPEQSKRLLKLGVPADSADCYWNDICGKPIPMQQGILYSDKRNQFKKVNVPVWSVGRLIEIHAMCAGASSSYYIHTFPTNIMNEIMWHLTEAIKKGWIDFSKLEE